MPRYLRAASLAAVFALMPLGPATAAECDRACLQSALDRYLAAVTRNDPAAAPLALGIRQTENAINVAPGQGVWKTVTSLGEVQRKYYDPVSGQAAYFGTVLEGEKPAIVTARIRVEDRKITEAEWYIARDGDPGLPGVSPPNFYDPVALAAHPPPQRVIPVAARLPRETLIAIVNSYFDGITSHDGSIVLAHSGCSRIENGTQVTGRRGGVADDCVSGLADFDLQLVAARRFPLVDEEAGVVLATAVFIRRPGSQRPRNVFSEWFFIDDAKIRSIYAAMFYPPPDLAVPNWPPYEGNWPLPAELAPAAAPAAQP